jgi:hypothetical protein
MLEIYDGRLVAVVFEIDGMERVVQGTAHYEVDELLGPVLRVSVAPDESDDSGGPADVLIAESEWDGRIETGEEFGCDYCFRPSHPN